MVWQTFCSATVVVLRHPGDLIVLVPLVLVLVGSLVGVAHSEQKTPLRQVLPIIPCRGGESGRLWRLKLSRHPVAVAVL
jgi:hypothetical protein